MKKKRNSRFRKMNVIMDPLKKANLKKVFQPKLSDFSKFETILKDFQIKNETVILETTNRRKTKAKIEKKQIQLKTRFLEKTKTKKKLQVEYEKTKKKYKQSKFEMFKFKNKIFYMEKDINLRKQQMNILQFIKNDMEKKTKHVNEVYLLSKNILKNTKKEIVENEYINNLILYKQKVDKFIVKRDKKLKEINELVSEVTELRKINIKKNLQNETLVLEMKLLKKEQKELRNIYHQQKINFNNTFVIVNLIAINYFINQYESEEFKEIEDTTILMAAVQKNPLNYLDDFIFDEEVMYEITKFKEKSDEYFDFDTKNILGDERESETDTVDAEESISLEDKTLGSKSMTQYDIGFNVNVTKDKDEVEVKSNLNIVVNEPKKEHSPNSLLNISDNKNKKAKTTLKGVTNNLLVVDSNKDISKTVSLMSFNTINNSGVKLLFSKISSGLEVSENNKKLFSFIKRKINLKNFIQKVIKMFLKLQNRLNKISDVYNANVLSKEVKMTKLFDLNNSKKFLKTFYGIKSINNVKMFTVRNKFMSFMKNKGFLKMKLRKKMLNKLQAISNKKDYDFCHVGSKKIKRGIFNTNKDDATHQKFTKIDIKDIAYIKNKKLKLITINNYVSNNKIEILNMYYNIFCENRLLEKNFDVNQKLILLSYILYSKLHEKIRMISEKIINFNEKQNGKTIEDLDVMIEDSRKVFSDRFNRDQHFVYNYIHFTKIILLRLDGHNFNLLFKLFDQIKKTVFIHSKHNIIDSLIRYLFYNAKDANFDVLEELEDIVSEEIMNDHPTNHNAKNINSKFNIIYPVMLTYLIRTNDLVLKNSNTTLIKMFKHFKRRKVNSMELQENKEESRASLLRMKKRERKSVKPLNRNSFIIKARKSKVLTNLNKTFFQLGSKDRKINITTKWSKSPERALINFKFSKRERTYSYFKDTKIDKIYKDYKLLNYKIKTIQSKNKGKRNRAMTETTKDTSINNSFYVFDTNSNRVNSKYRISKNKINPFLLKGRKMRETSYN